MKHYVYAHINPENGEIVYIGAGSGKRMGTTDLGNRAVPHSTFLTNLKRLGYEPKDWAVKLVDDLDRDEAFELEKQLIAKIKPMFNKLGASRPRLLNDDQVREIRRRRADGETYTRLAADFDFNVGSLYRIVHGSNYVNVA